jgi:hypothetical protein
MDLHFSVVRLSIFVGYLDFSFLDHLKSSLVFGPALCRCFTATVKNHFWKERTLQIFQSHVAG